METKKSLNKYSQSVISTNDAVHLLLCGKRLTGVLTDSEELTLHAQHKRLFNIKDTPRLNSEILSVEEFHALTTSHWNFPDKYKQINVLDYLLNKCSTQAEIDRIRSEYKVYEEYDLTIMLNFFIYLVDYMRDNKHLWGVGRGSSVASYSLYLIGIHRIDSIKYNLPFNEFLR